MITNMAKPPFIKMLHHTRLNQAYTLSITTEKKSCFMIIYPHLPILEEDKQFRRSPKIESNFGSPTISPETICNSQLLLGEALDWHYSNPQTQVPPLHEWRHSHAVPDLFWGEGPPGTGMEFSTDRQKPGAGTLLLVGKLAPGQKTGTEGSMNCADAHNFCCRHPTTAKRTCFRTPRANENQWKFRSAHSWAKTWMKRSLHCENLIWVFWKFDFTWFFYIIDRTIALSRKKNNFYQIYPEKKSMQISFNKLAINTNTISFMFCLLPDIPSKYWRLQRLLPWRSAKVGLGADGGAEENVPDSVVCWPPPPPRDGWFVFFRLFHTVNSFYF